MGRIARFVLLPLVLVTLTACDAEMGAADEALDGEDEAFLLPGKADGDVPQACAILKLANTASLDVLDDDVALNAKAARGIVAHRDGPDGLPGTDDDGWFATLAELDAVKYVGTATFHRFEDYVDENPATACGTVAVQLLAFSDFHGALEPPSGSSGKVKTRNPADPAAPIEVEAGGIEFLATTVKALAATNPNTVVVSAGDNIGATPLVSAAFHDEPTVDALNLLGLAISAVGNHELDEASDELLRVQQGGCHPVEGCFDENGFAGARFRYVAANVRRDDTGETLFPPYAVRTFGNARVAFVGLTVEGAPSVLTSAGAAGLTFGDEVAAVTALVPELEARGIETIVVLLHEGGATTGYFDECAALTGPLVDIARALPPAVDVVVAGHTNAAHVCDIDGRLVTGSASNGRLLTDIDLVIDEATGDVVTKGAVNQIVVRTVAKDAEQTALITKWKGLVATLANRVVATLGANVDLLKTPNVAGESSMGDVIADAQLASTDGPDEGGAQIAFMNPGGIRADLKYATIYGGEQPGEVTYGELFTIQPFANNLMTVTLTGAQIIRALQQQWCTNGTVDRGVKSAVLQVSEGFTYAWDDLRPACGDRLDVASVRLNGAPLDPAASYRVTINIFLVGGGDGFPALAEGTDRTSAPGFDLDALIAYFTAHPALPAPAGGRISIVERF